MLGLINLNVFYIQKRSVLLSTDRLLIGLVIYLILLVGFLAVPSNSLLTYRMILPY